MKPRDVAAFKLFARLDDGSLLGHGRAEERGVTEELEDAFGGPWAGFAVALAPAGGRFRLVADITSSSGPSRRRGSRSRSPPIVMAFGTDRFVDHYLLSVIVAQETVEKRVDTSVTQPFQ